MAQTTPNLQLTVWNNLTDPYNSEQLANNFIKLDQHDHSPGKGAQIDGSSIKDASITNAKLAANSVTTGTIASGAVQTTDLADITTGSETTTGVTTSKIANGAITTNKILDSTITRSDLRSNVGGNSTPYIISSATTLPSSNLLTGDEVYYTASSNTVWHLRYNGTSWDFLGGPSLYKESTGAIISDSSPTIGSWYGYWGSGTNYGAFNSIALPLAGTYTVTYSGTMYNSGTDVASGIFGTALAIGAQSANNTAITDYNSSNSLSETNGILSGSGAYSYFNTSLDNASGSPRYTVFGTHRFNLNADASGASNVNNRYIKQAFGVLYGATGTFSIGVHKITLTPVTLTNW